MRLFALPKYRLLRKPAEFDKVYRVGKRLHSAGFTLIFMASGSDNSRIGISVNRKVKGAVVRNRIKRIFKESFRRNRDIYPQRADIVIAVRPDFKLGSQALIDDAIAHLMIPELT